MGYQDEWLNQLTGYQKEFTSAAKHLGELGNDARTFEDINKLAFDSFNQIAASFQIHSAETIAEQINSIQRYALNNFEPLNFSKIAAEVMQQAVMPLAETSHSSFAQIAADITKYIDIPRTDFAAVARMAAATAVADFNTAHTASSSIDSAIAAFRTEQVNGLESFRESFAGIIADTLREGLEALEQRDEHAFARFEQLIEEKIATLPQNQVTTESLLKFLLMLFATLAPSLYAIKQSNDSETVRADQHTQQMKILGEQKGLLEKIAIMFQPLLLEHNENIYYVVERQVSLKLKPNNKAANVAILFPNQKTRLVKMNHKWIYVEYFDYLDGVPKYGWANKKYLKRIGD